MRYFFFIYLRSSHLYATKPALYAYAFFFFASIRICYIVGGMDILLIRKKAQNFIYEHTLYYSLKIFIITFRFIIYIF